MRGQSRGVGDGGHLGTEEIEQIRVLLRSRFEDLDREYEEAVAQNTRLRLVEIANQAWDSNNA